ncbi:hypothetical protein NC651_008092 [Populus alba x Populus x berolinensis]|nr:hypothetical protein NC651_008092 [Populus alba x Populus x berolinensis]
MKSFPSVISSPTTTWLVLFEVQVGFHVSNMRCGEGSKKYGVIHYISKLLLYSRQDPHVHVLIDHCPAIFSGLNIPPDTVYHLIRTS